MRPFSVQSSPVQVQYQLAGRLKGEQGDAINCLAISEQGNLLASGSDQGMKVWDLHRLEGVPSVARRHAFCDPVSVAMWITCKDDARETLCFGTGLGYLVFWRQTGTAKIMSFEEVVVKRVGTGSEITCMTSGPTDSGTGVRLATGTRERQVMVWTFDNDVLVPSMSIQLATTVPKGIAFVDGQKDLYVWGLYDGQMLTVRSDGKVVKTTSLSTAIGGVAMHEKNPIFLIDNVTDGFSLHSVESGHLIRSYPTKPSIPKAKQVAFGEKGAIVVGGGEHGSAYVFDRKQGTRLQCLQHGKEGLVQTIAVYDGDTHTSIITATSSNVANPTVSIWKRNYHRPKRDPTAPKKSDPAEQGLLRMLNMAFTAALRLLLICILTVILIDMGLSINRWKNGDGAVADIIGALRPTTWREDDQAIQRRSHDATLAAARWQRVKEGVARHHAAQLAWQRAEEEIAKDDITEPTSSVIYNSPPAITRAASKLDEGWGKDGDGSVEDEIAKDDITESTSSVIYNSPPAIIEIG